MNIIRSNQANIQTNTEGREALSSTLSLYRALVRDIMTVASTHWPLLNSTRGNECIKIIESLIHPTSKRPIVKYTYFQKRYYKFPSYLRRVAIKDAVGQARSFYSRYDSWLDGERSSPKAKPPKLTCATNTFPSLYQGQCIKFNKSGTAAFIKVFWNNDWIWMNFRLTGQHRYQGKKLSPLLKLNRKQWTLSIPHKFEVETPDCIKKSTRVLSLDVGINTTATCAVVNTQGTVLHRQFFQRSDKDREYFLMQRIRNTASIATRHGNKLTKGFCNNDYRRLKQLAKNEAHQISRKIVNLALEQQCHAIIAEDLKGWRPRGGRKRSNLKARFHKWYHRMLVNLIEQKSKEAGIRFVTIYARGTSSNAFDGSGKVKRDKKNYALAEFTSGKKYNADLNAAYNIAARGIVKVFYPGVGNFPWGGSKQKSHSASRNPITLSTVWLLNATQMTG